ncbi:MAG TPA: hypothetical protein VNZ52_04740 [Candidatus Thermoplasmatota archaeon]|nr:hypothetical protein [Candidatus Thermoplasmatota archaeon]
MIVGLLTILLPSASASLVTISQPGGCDVDDSGHCVGFLFGGQDQHPCPIWDGEIHRPSDYYPACIPHKDPPPS